MLKLRHLTGRHWDPDEAEARVRETGVPNAPSAEREMTANPETRMIELLDELTTRLSRALRGPVGRQRFGTFGPVTPQ